MNDQANIIARLETIEAVLLEEADPLDVLTHRNTDRLRAYAESAGITVKPAVNQGWRDAFFAAIAADAPAEPKSGK